MLSLRPLTPGRRTQKPRTIRSIFTPACEARYSSRQTLRSSRLFILAMMRAGLPALAMAASRLDHLQKPRCMFTGATSSLR